MNREEAERRANNSFRLIFNLEIRCLFFGKMRKKRGRKEYRTYEIISKFSLPVPIYF